MEFERKRRDIKTLYDSFGDKVDKDVIDMVYAECGNRVMDAINCLVSMSGESPNMLTLATTNTTLSTNAEELPTVSARGNAAPQASPIRHTPESPLTELSNFQGDTEPLDEADGFAVVSNSKQKPLARKPIQQADQKVMYIMRGLPGSGKSFRARELKGKFGVVLSTDDYFERDGRFLYNPRDLKEAHAWNQTRAKIATDNNVTPVVIDNTNTQAWEMKAYAAMAMKNGYSVEICEPKTPWSWNIDELAKRNSHGVPYEKIASMLQRYEHGVTVDRIMQSNGPQESRRSEPQRHPLPAPTHATSSESVPSNIKAPAATIPRQSSLRHSSPKSPIETDDRNFKKELAANRPMPQYPRTKNINDLDVIMTDNVSEIPSNIIPDFISPKNLLLKPVVTPPYTPMSMSGLIAKPPIGSEDAPIDISSADEITPAKNVIKSKPIINEVAIEADEQLTFLQSCFPDITQTMLANILKVNGDDVMKTCDELLRNTIFIDFDNENEDEDDNDDDDDDDDNNHKPINVADSNTDISSRKQKNNVPSSIKPTEKASRITNVQGSLGLSDESSQNQLIVKVDENLCLQLKEFFGYDNDTVGWDVTDTSVHIPLDVGQQLYHALELAIKTQKATKELLEQRGFSKPSTCCVRKSHESYEVNVSQSLQTQRRKSFSTADDEIYAQQLQLYDECAKSGNTSTPMTRDQLKEIGDASDGGKRTWGNTTFGSSTEYRAAEQSRKRVKLFKTFPGVDEEALLQILEANGYDLEMSIRLAASSCGVSLNNVPIESNASEYVIVPSSKPSPNASNAAASSITYKIRDTSPLSPARRVPDDGFQIAENPKYADYRAEAQIHFDMRKRYLSEAAKAYSEKRGLIAQYYADKAREQYDKMQNANMRAAAMILSKNQQIITQKGNDNVLDIHGLHVSEALLVVEHYLKLATDSGKQSVAIVTGRGLHSKGGKARLKPAVLKYLRKHGIRHYLNNGGQVVVYI